MQTKLLLWLTTVVHYLCALGIIVALGTDKTLSGGLQLPATLTSLVSDETESKLVSSTRTVFTWRPVYLIMAYFLITALFQMYQLLAILRQERQATSRRFGDPFTRGSPNTPRWVEYSITSSLMFVVVAGYAGVEDFNTLLLLVACNVAVMMTGYMVESSAQTLPINKFVHRERYLADVAALALGSGLGTATWIPIAVALGESQDGGALP